MNRSKSFAFFILFMASILLALTLKFQYLVIDRDESLQAMLTIGVCVLAAAVFMCLSLRALNHSKGIARAMADGIGISLVAMLGVSLTESVLSDQSYSKVNTPEAFSFIEGHCGVYAGRTLLKIFHAQSSDPRRGAFREFRIKERCRLDHLSFAMKQHSSFCEPSEDQIDCQVRWMGGISEHGFWNRNTRKFFFDQVIKRWPESKKEEALVAYVLKDQELESGRQSIARQAGIDDVMTDRSLFLQAREELQNLNLTKEIFATIEPMLTDTTVNPPPYLFKFKDAQTEVQTKIAKIPEMEKEVEQFQNKAKDQL